jgi:hypothetical protein
VDVHRHRPKIGNLPSLHVIRNVVYGEHGWLVAGIVVPRVGLNIELGKPQALVFLGFLGLATSATATRAAGGVLHLLAFLVISALAIHVVALLHLVLVLDAVDDLLVDKFRALVLVVPKVRETREVRGMATEKGGKVSSSQLWKSTAVPYVIIA